jgi:hypothetical protein
MRAAESFSATNAPMASKANDAAFNLPTLPVNPIYYGLLLRHTPLTETYGNGLIDQVFQGVRPQGS